MWPSQSTEVRDYLAAVLSQIIRYDYTHRFQSANQVLKALQQIPQEQWQLQTIFTKYTVVPDNVEDTHLQPEPIDRSIKNKFADDSVAAKSEKSSPLLTGMKFGLVANCFFIGFGACSLMSSYPGHSETETLYEATEKYQLGDFEQPISFAK